MATPVLYHIEVSHYNEKARWALDYKGIPHVRKAPPADDAHGWAFAMTRGATFPVLKMNGDTIGDSTQIIEALERTTRSRRCTRPTRTSAPARWSWRSSSTRSSRRTSAARCFAEVTRDARRSPGSPLRPAGPGGACRFQGDGRPRRAAAAAALRHQRRERRAQGWEKTVRRDGPARVGARRTGLPRRRQLHGRRPDRRRAVLPARAAGRGPVPRSRSRCPRRIVQRRRPSSRRGPASSGCRRCTAATAASRPKSCLIRAPAPPAAMA